MSNLDLYELRSKLKHVHESQGVSKSVAMKLMQELEEARAKGRKEWGRANKAEASVARVREVSNMDEHGDVSSSEETAGFHVALRLVRHALDGEQS